MSSASLAVYFVSFDSTLAIKYSNEQWEPSQCSKQEKKNTKKTNIHTRVYIYPTDVSTVAHFALLSHSAHQHPSTSFPQFNVSRRSQMLFVGASVPRCAVDLSAHGCMCACTININCWLVYTRQSCNCINEPSKHNWSTYVQRISVWINILISIQIL